MYCILDMSLFFMFYSCRLFLLIAAWAVLGTLLAAVTSKSINSGCNCSNWLSSCFMAFAEGEELSDILRFSATLPLVTDSLLLSGCLFTASSACYLSSASNAVELGGLLRKVLEPYAKSLKSMEKVGPSSSPPRSLQLVLPRGYAIFWSKYYCDGITSSRSFDMFLVS